MSILKKRSESSGSQSESSMHFWGICCESGKQYAQVVGQRFRITMAVLDPKSFNSDISDKTVSLLVIRGGIEYLLCVLKHGEIHQVSLNLIFDKGENVKFYINGHGKVYLSGYQLTDSEGDVLNDENGYLCPLVEVKMKIKKESASVSPKNQKKAKSKIMASEEDQNPLWNLIMQKEVDDDDDDDEEDEDFSIGDEESESEEGSSSDDDDDEEEEELDDDLDDEESENEVVMNSHGSQKRKRAEKLSFQKRSRNESLNSSSNSVKNDEDDETSDSLSDDFTTPAKLEESSSSIGHTPMPKKTSMSPAAENVSSETKKSKKKKKKKSGMLDSSDHSINSKNDKEDRPTANESTPKQKRNPPVVKNGVEIQDVLVGRGPMATPGKTAHVFYVGRLPDSRIFDSRLPGKKPFSFKLGAHQVIKGWDVGIAGMKVGGKRKLKIPPQMGYGKSALEGIPPNSTLSFVVELQAVS